MELYDKLLETLNQNLYTLDIQLAYGDAEDVLKVIWPQIVELLATNLEYEHALEHVTGPHDNPTCSDCQRLAQSALNGVNHQGFKEVIEDANTDWKCEHCGRQMGTSSFFPGEQVCDNCNFHRPMP